MLKEEIGVAILGLGTVGTGVVKVLEENKKEIESRLGVPIVVKKILVRDLKKNRTIEIDKELLTDNFEEALKTEGVDIVVELMGGEQPAKDYLFKAIALGKHVVTANKDMIAKYGSEIMEKAKDAKVNVAFEASVAGGIPIISPIRECMVANKIEKVLGIINGTTNYMLTKMTDEGLDFAEVLKEAQEKGYAEADPTADVGGLDAARKITILASLAFRTKVNLSDVHVEGITKITKEDIAYAKEFGFVIKLLAIANDLKEGIDVRVHPTLVPENHPLASVSDVFNAVFVRGNAVGDLMFYGRGAGGLPTASAVCGDLVAVSKDILRNVINEDNIFIEQKKHYSIEKIKSSYYLLLWAKDQSGVFAAIANVFGKHNVSMRYVVQKRQKNSFAEIVVITHNISDENMRQAVNSLEAMSVVKEVVNVLRVLDE